MKILALALLCLASPAHASVADFHYDLELQLTGLDAGHLPRLSAFQLAFDGYQVDTVRDCRIVAEQQKLLCAGDGTVYPGLSEVALRIQVPATIEAEGTLEYRFEEQSSKTSLPVSLREKKSLRASLAWEETPAPLAGVSGISVAAAAPVEEPVDAPIPLEAETIVESGKPAAKPVAKKPGAQRATRQ